MPQATGQVVVEADGCQDCTSMSTVAYKQVAGHEILADVHPAGTDGAAALAFMWAMNPPWGWA